MWGSGLMFSGLGCRVEGLWFQVSCLGCMVLLALLHDATIVTFHGVRTLLRRLVKYRLYYTGAPIYGKRHVKGGLFKQLPSKYDKFSRPADSKATSALAVLGGDIQAVRDEHKGPTTASLGFRPPGVLHETKCAFPVQRVGYYDDFKATA